MDKNIYKIALAGFLHDIGKFCERADMPVNAEFFNNNAKLYQPLHNNRHTHKHAVYTAAFLNHIEEFLPQEMSKDAGDSNDTLINLVAGHHNPQTPLQWIIAIADRASSGFTPKEFDDYNNELGVKDYKRTRLLTIFEGVSLDEKWKDDLPDSYHFRYPLKELSPDSLFPKNINTPNKANKTDEIDTTETDTPNESNDPDKSTSWENKQSAGAYSGLFSSFEDALKNLEHKQNIPLWVEHFDSLFMIYTSHMPAATVGKTLPDVSLYDHCKTTAALATAIYLYHLHTKTMEKEKISDYEDKKFLMVTGDFYGIQNFIFTEGGSTKKAPAKLLRGRSFAVSLITELAADMLCKAIGLPACSVILNAAGKFTLLAPNTDTTRSAIKTVEEKINDWMIKMFYGQATIGISFIEASCSDFSANKFTDLWDSLTKELEKKRYSKINLEQYGGVVGNYLNQFNNELKSKLCPFCAKRPSNKEVGDDLVLGDKSACTICRDHIYLGTHLVKSPRIAVTTIDVDLYGDALKEPIFGEYQVSLKVSKKFSNELAEKGTLLKYWDISIAEGGRIAKDIAAKFINGYVPVYTADDQTDEAINRLLHGNKTEKTKNELFDLIKEDAPKTFHHIAKMALNPKTNEERFSGTEALGVLKADVDNLGLIFACGLKHNCLSQLANMSRQMNYYFSIYLPYVLATKKEFNDIYTVFAGGDDLFLIGPWNKIADFALFLNDSFKKYVCGNKHITLSAGLSVHKPGEPVQYIAETAEEALKKSKGNDRNSITFFNDPIHWGAFVALDNIKKTIGLWLDETYINNAMLFRLNTFSDMAGKEKELLDVLKEMNAKGVAIEECECLKWKAMFRYALARNVGNKLKGEKKDLAIKEVEKAADWLERHCGAMKVPVWQIIYNQRTSAK